tara:strand:+ start:404 stop:661 length:258 start_codon:yes stop_codon:yes gene_type:complete
MPLREIIDKAVKNGEVKTKEEIIEALCSLSKEEIAEIAFGWMTNNGMMMKAMMYFEDVVEPDIFYSKMKEIAAMHDQNKVERKVN